MKCGLIYKQKEKKKPGKIQVKSGIVLLVMHQCHFLNSDKYIMVIQDVNNEVIWVRGI